MDCLLNYTIGLDNKKTEQSKKIKNSVRLRKTDGVCNITRESDIMNKREQTEKVGEYAKKKSRAGIVIYLTRRKAF